MMTSKNSTGKEIKFLHALLNGRTLSRRQVTAQYKLLNPSAAVLRFVESGYVVDRAYSTKKIKGAYVTTVKYSIQ